MKNNLHIALVLFSLMTFSCSEWKSYFQDKEPVASVGDKVLYIEDLDNVFFDDMSYEDSMMMLESYVDVWVKKQLKIAEAEQIFSASQTEIDRRVEEYRGSLLTYRIDQYYIDNSIDTVFTDDEIGEYYQAKRSDFILDRPMVKGLMVKMPSRFRQARELSQLMRSNSADSHQDFIDICSKNELEYKDIAQWSYFNEALAFLPTRRDYDYGYLMSEKKIHEFTDGDNIYYAYISDVLEAGDYIPQDMVSDVIRSILFNRRKESIIRTHEDRLMQQGLDEKQINIYIPKRD